MTDPSLVTAPDTPLSHLDLALLTDFYQLTMMGGYAANGRSDQQAVFELYFRGVPEGGGFCVATGLETALAYIASLRFTPADIQYLRSLEQFDGAFLEALASFRFEGDVHAIEEGTPVFPGQPLLRVSARLPQAQLLESALLNIVNFQTLIATKAARVCLAAGDDGHVLEFGLRRAQGIDGALSASRAAYIGGCEATSNVLAGRLHGIPVRGTQAHAWVMSFESELEAFRAYARAYPNDTALLVDTYDTLGSGVPNAICVAHEMAAEGRRLRAIRLDSGDLAHLSKESRRMLDEAGLGDVRIIASNDLDEHLILALKAQGAPIDVWGVGTRLVTSSRAPALGGVYKLVAAADAQGGMTPRIKISSNPEKSTVPSVKQVWRTYDAGGRPAGDVLALADETFGDGAESIRTRHASLLYASRTLRAARVEPLLVPVIEGGRRVAPPAPIAEVRARTRRQLAALPDAHKRFVDPEPYWVGLSERLFELRARLIEEAVRPS